MNLKYHKYLKIMMRTEIYNQKIKQMFDKDDFIIYNIKK